MRSLYRQHNASRSPRTPQRSRSDWPINPPVPTFLFQTNQSCQIPNRTLVLLNSSWRSTLVLPIAASHTVFFNEEKFPWFLGLRGKFFISLYRSALTGLRFPAQALVSGDAKVPSLLYYDGTGTVRAAGAEVLAENVLETAQTEGWSMVEWLVGNDVKRIAELILIHGIQVEASSSSKAFSLLYYLGRCLTSTPAREICRRRSHRFHQISLRLC